MTAETLLTRVRRRSITTWAAALVALACAGSLRAHHSISMFDLSKPTWIKGTVVHYEAVLPHALVVLDEREEDGQVRRLTVEGPNLVRLERMGAGKDFLKAGDAIEVCGFPFKEDIVARNASTHDGVITLPAFHGQMLVMPDGRMRSFGPYGKLDNCVRPKDRAQMWVEFLNSDPLARDAWCGSLRYVQTALLPPQSFVDEVSRAIANPCG